MFDVMIVGSGPAGTMAARALPGKRVLVLDVGRQPDAPPPLKDGLYEERRHREDLFDFLIGEKFEALHNLHNAPISLKLKSPFMRYVEEGAAALSPVRSRNFQSTMSFAMGGLANAWGAGVYRFTDRDLEGFPIRREELEPFYEDLTAHIGISGANDDLAPSFGEDRTGLQPPVMLSRFGSDLLAGYQRRRAWFAKAGVKIGYSRNAVLTRPHRGRDAYRYGNYEFFRPHDPAIYNPAYSLLELIEAGRVAYESERLVLGYEEVDGGVAVTARNLATGAHEVYRGRSLILAAGALNSAKLVLASNQDDQSQLPVLDNPVSAMPLFRLPLIGRALDATDHSLCQLNLICEHAGQVLQGSIYGSAGPLRSDILFDLPLSISANAAWLRRLTVATGMLMLFYPAAPSRENYLRLAQDGALEISCEAPVRGAAERVLLRAFRQIGFYASPALIRYPPMGAGIHYAGTLPMREAPARYQLYPDGRLFGTRAVYVADGACFPRLPAKNLTFTIMANAMRIASGLRERLT